MSIVNEALKKAARDKGKNGASAEEKFTFSDRTIGVKRSLFLIGIAVIIIAALGLLLWKGNIYLIKTKSKGDAVSKAKAAPEVDIKKAAEVKKEDDTSRINEKEAVEHQKRALELYKEKRLAEATAELLTAVSLKPDIASAHNNLGLIYKEGGAYDKAVFEYQEALRIDPKYLDAMNNLAVLYDNQGRYKEAEGLFKKAIEIDAANPAINLNYAITLERMGRIEDAKRHYRIYLNLIPKEDKELGERIKRHLSNLKK
ncbi:MAG: tetratricopeptide repeat protein [Nitrospirae bacterium]|nr:tetratricopeptide repeat protein [Nitrospirota bacterium]